MTPEDLKEIVGDNGLSHGLKRYIRCEFAETYQEFVAVVNDVLDEAAKILRKHSHLEYDRANIEDGLSSQISTVLECHGLSARPTHARGNTDIFIESISKQSFSIVCEAKVLGGPNDYSNSHLFGGVQQLCTRYDTGDCDNHFSVFLIYNYKDKNNFRLQNWLEHFFDKANEESFPCLADCTYIGSHKNGRFFTSHLHCDTYEQVYVRHLAIPLHFDPKDRK